MLSAFCADLNKFMRFMMVLREPFERGLVGVLPLLSSLPLASDDAERGEDFFGGGFGTADVTVLKPLTLMPKLDDGGSFLRPGNGRGPTGPGPGADLDAGLGLFGG